MTGRSWKKAVDTPCQWCRNMSDSRAIWSVDPYLKWVLSSTGDQEVPVLPNLQTAEETLEIHIFFYDISQFKNMEHTQHCVRQKKTLECDPPASSLQPILKEVIVNPRTKILK